MSTSQSEAEVFQTLPVILKGVAAMWFQVEKHRWNTWSDFCSAARRWYGTGRGYQQRLLTVATAKTQGEDELARDFTTYLLVIIRKMEPIPSLETQLDMLHRNLRRGLQKLVRRADFHDIDELQEMAKEAELTLEMEHTFRPPPSPESTMLPETAYKPRNSKSAKPKISVVEAGGYEGFAGKETSVDQSLLAAISRLETRLNELRSKQNARPEKHKPSPENTPSGKEKEKRMSTGDGKKSDTGRGTDERAIDRPGP